MDTAIHDASELQSELNPNPVPHVDKLTEHNKPTPSKPATTPLATAVVGTHIRHTIVFTRTRSAPTVENRAISGEFVVPNGKESLNMQPKPQRYMLLRLMLMLMHVKKY